MQGFGKGSGRGQGTGGGMGGGRRGQMMGSGMGAGGFCVCAKCGRRILHRQGVQCMEERCPDCGVALVREGSEHHREIEMRRKQTDGENE